MMIEGTPFSEARRRERIGSRAGGSRGVIGEEEGTVELDVGEAKTGIIK